MAFDNNDGRYAVLTNNEGQYSLWPENLNNPAGWNMAREPMLKAEAVAYVEANWNDMRPRSLQRAMAN